MTLFYETNIWSKHRQYLQQCEKKNFDADKSLYALKKKALILVEEKKPATMQILLMLQPK